MYYVQGSLLSPLDDLIHLIYTQTSVVGIIITSVLQEDSSGICSRSLS
jgi:hypothetical protein